jgi:hypothetical protein
MPSRWRDQGEKQGSKRCQRRKISIAAAADNDRIVA